LAGKPPIGEVAEVLCEYGVQPDSEPGPGEGGQRPQPDSGPPAPDLMREIAEQLAEAYHSLDLGTRISVTRAEVTGDATVLTVALTRPAGDTRPLPPQPVRQAFKISAGAITQITGLPLSSPDT
jgi:hypothetical protein